jgi:acyl-CoA synthetase (AMP-forming)/AMP-acid ligase II
MALASALVFALVGTGGAAAHSASDAYLSLDAQPASTSVSLQWDIALRDLDFVMTLDDNGDGNITWGELRRHEKAIAQYAQSHLTVLANGKPCALSVAKQQVSGHADGAYAALFLQARCPAAPTHLTLDYRLFFDIDPSHRAIVVAHTGPDTATALLSPQNARVELDLTRPAKR